MDRRRGVQLHRHANNAGIGIRGRIRGKDALAFSLKLDTSDCAGQRRAGQHHSLTMGHPNDVGLADRTLCLHKVSRANGRDTCWAGLFSGAQMQRAGTACHRC